MHTVSSEVDQIVRQVLATGHYSDPDELLLDALHAFLSQSDSVAAIREGQEGVRAGRTRPWQEAISDAKAKDAL